MRQQTKRIASVAGAPVLFTRFEAGYDLAAIFGEHILGTSGLDGGTFTVECKIPGNDTDWYVIATAQAQTALVQIAFPVTQLRVVFAGLGGAAAAKAYLVSRPWGNFRAA